MAGFLSKFHLSSIRTTFKETFLSSNARLYSLTTSKAAGSTDVDTRNRLQNIDPDSSEFGPCSLDHGEVMSFLFDNLQMKNVDLKLTLDKVGFMNEVLDCLKHSVPWTNLTLISLLANEELPCNHESYIQQINHDMLSLRGGLCYWFGTFLQALFKKLDFHAHLIGGNDRVFDVIYDMHQAVIVQDVVSNGSLYLLETSPTYPIFQAIPLHLGNEALVHNFAKVRRMFIKCERGILKYCYLLGQGQRPSSHLSEIIEYEGGQWEVKMTYRYHSIRPASRFLEYIYYAQLAPIVGTYHLQNIIINGYSRGKWISVFNCRVTVRDTQGVYLYSFQVPSFAKVKDIIEAYFPQYPPSLVDECISYVQKSQKHT